MIVLSGDVGGTSTRLQFTEFTDDGTSNVIKTSFYSNDKYQNFDDILKSFFAETNIKVDGACFGVAGPVADEMVQFTNLSWEVSAYEIRHSFNIEKVHLLNDFVAIGYGLETLKKEDLFTLQEGKPRENSIIAYTGAGTGLGVGFITPMQNSYEVHPTEGGHIDFAPVNDVQNELLRFLQKKHHRVCIERLLSGQGLINIYSFVRSQEGTRKKDSELDVLIDGKNQSIDIAAAIAEHATKYGDVLAKRALSIFISIYGTFVGNFALTTLPFGGLYIVGGIAPKLLTQIREWGFLEAYRDKGRMSDLVKDIPLHVVLCMEVGLQGAALYAKKFLLDSDSTSSN